MLDEQTKSHLDYWRRMHERAVLVHDAVCDAWAEDKLPVAVCRNACELLREIQDGRQAYFQVVQSRPVRPLNEPCGDPLP